MNSVPLFKSHYSIGKSPLTLEKANEKKKTGPVSIIDLALKAKLSRLFLVEDGMSGFLEAFENSKNAGLQLTYGLRMTCTQDVNEKSEESLSRNHKIIIFHNNNGGYQRLINLFTQAASKDCFYYEPRVDFKMLKTFWDNTDLTLAIPFYDSFLYRNALSYSCCVPDFGYTEPVFFVEDNLLPVDGIVRARVDEYANKHLVVPTKTICYEKRSDYKAYLTFRCINNRTTLNKPEFEHMSSNEFCLESWQEQNSFA